MSLNGLQNALRVVACLAIALLSPMLARAQEDEELALPDNPLAGRALFEERQCSRCHTIEAGGSGPSLADGGFDGSFLDLGAALWNHVPGMTVQHGQRELPWPALEPDEALELLAFLHYIDYLGRPGVPERGRELFARDGCRSCHALGGQGGQSVGPDLASLDRYASPLYVAQAIWNHGPKMLESMRARGMRPPRFDDGDLADLSAYMRSSSRNGGERVLLGPGNPNRGAALFRDKGCARCHSAAGPGPTLAGRAMHHSAESIAGNMWNHAVEMEESIRALGMSWPQFTTTEMADLVAFLYFRGFEDGRGDAVRGREVFVSRSCESCHSGTADATHPGPALTGTDARPSPVTLVASMWNHAPMMREAILEAGKPWPLLTGQDLRDLLAFLSGNDRP